MWYLVVNERAICRGVWAKMVEKPPQTMAGTKDQAKKDHILSIRPSGQFFMSCKIYKLCKLQVK